MEGGQRGRTATGQLAVRLRNAVTKVWQAPTPFQLSSRDNYFIVHWFKTISSPLGLRCEGCGIAFCSTVESRYNLVCFVLEHREMLQHHIICGFLCGYVFCLKTGLAFK